MNPIFQIMPMWTPFLPTNCSKPPTIYSILQSIVNYGADERTSTSNLAKQGRTTIFDFDYPLSENVSRETFECMILNHFMMRRIGYETMTAFKIALDVKLNEIMPNYNLLFDAMHEWTLFDNGEVYERNVTDTRNISSTSSINNITNDSNISDRRYSNTPQNAISDVQSGTYVTDYNYDTSTGNASSSTSGTSSSTDGGSLTERITRTNDDTKQIDILLKFTQRKKDIYTMIFKDLDVLFYQLD